MIDFAVSILKDLPVVGVLAFACFITFLENVFPPAPSDVLLVICGTMVGLSATGFVPMVICSTAGSVGGFALMYWVGKRFGENIVNSGKIKFLPPDLVLQAEHWFQHYGFGIIVANRFLSGTRAVISIFAGMSELPFPKTLVLSGVSAAVWNTILIGAGAAVGKNWENIDYYLTLYGKIVSGAAVVIAVFFIARKVLQATKNKKQASADADTAPTKEQPAEPN